MLQLTNYDYWESAPVYCQEFALYILLVMRWYMSAIIPTIEDYAFFCFRCICIAWTYTNVKQKEPYLQL